MMIITNIPITIPNKDSMVLSLLATKELQAIRALSEMILKSKWRNLLILGVKIEI
jgi:hypothetical protein